MTSGQGTPLITPWGPLVPLMMEFAAISVTADYYKIRGVHDFRSGYTADHSLRSFKPSNDGVCSCFSHCGLS